MNAMLSTGRTPAVHPLIEPSLFYDPPYERPLEDEFAWHLVKYLNPISALDYQVRVETACAPFWVDFVVEDGVRRVGFECGEGEESVDDDEVRLRAALILGTGDLDVLYRFRGADLLYRLHDCLFLASRWDRGLFSPRGRINLNTLASPEAQACRVHERDTTVRLCYAGEAVDGPAELVAHRLTREQPATWMQDYDRALSYFGLSDDALQARWAKSA